LRPVDKAELRFLAALQMEIDPELGRRPLEGRPSPSTYAERSSWYPVAQALRTGRRFASKASQRLRRGNRPPAGGEVVARKVVEWWRSHPDVLATLASLDFIRQDWIDDVLADRQQARPSTVGFLTNLVVATSRT
jgi:asparagine synthase (glutamine-hydrolysing)